MSSWLIYSFRLRSFHSLTVATRLIEPGWPCLRECGDGGRLFLERSNERRGRPTPNAPRGRPVEPRRVTISRGRTQRRALSVGWSSIEMQDLAYGGVNQTGNGPLLNLIN